MALGKIDSVWLGLEGFIFRAFIGKRGIIMANLVEFGRMFFSYGLLMLIIVAVGAVAVTIGINLAKKKNAKNEAASEDVQSV